MGNALTVVRLFEEEKPAYQDPLDIPADLEDEVRKWYATVSGLFPDTVAKRPRIQTITRGVDAYRSLIDMGFSFEAIKENLAWGLTQPFWADRIVYLHNLVDMLSGEPITLYEAVARARQIFKKGNSGEGADNTAHPETLPAYARRMLAYVEGQNPALSARQRGAVIHFLTAQVPTDHRLLKAHFDGDSYGFTIMYPTVGAYVRAYAAYCGDAGHVTSYSFIGTVYSRFVDSAIVMGGMKLLVRLRKKEAGDES